MPCNECGKSLPIVNVKYGLCPNCNSIRLTGKTLSDRKYQSFVMARERARANQKPINRISDKEAAIKQALSNLKEEIRWDAIRTNTYRCCGCGKLNTPLDCSHILSVGMFKKYELVKENIQLLCRSCHDKWHVAKIEEVSKFHCFEDNLRFIKTLEPLEHQKFLTKMTDTTLSS